MEDPLISVPNRREDGTFGPGNIANPNGRPKGKTMKEFAREFLMSKTDEEKREFLEKVGLDITWRMAEGNPAQDLTSNGKEINPAPIMHVVRDNNSNGESQKLEQEN